MKLNTRVEVQAVTTREITGACIPTIPMGTQFTLIAKGNVYSSCKGIPINLIWNDEFDIIMGDFQI